MTHNLTQTNAKHVVGAGDNPLPTSRMNLLSSASTSFIALMDYMEAMMKLAHNAAENKIAATQSASLQVGHSAQFTADVQNKQADATEFSANMQFTGMAENLCGGLVAGGSLYAQHSTTKFSTQMDTMLAKSNEYKNRGGSGISEGSPLIKAKEDVGRFTTDENRDLQDYVEKINKGSIPRATYERLAKSKSMFDEPLDDPLELGETGRRRSIVTLGHVLAHTQDQTLFSDLVDGVAQGREAANLAVTRKQNQIESASGLGNAVVKSVISGVNGGQTLQQAQAQRDQGAASQQQALSQGGLQFLQDAMKTPDQLFESCYAAAAQVLTGNLATMVSVDTRA